MEDQTVVISTEGRAIVKAITNVGLPGPKGDPGEGGVGGWPTVNGSGSGNLNAATNVDDIVGYQLTDNGIGGIHITTAGNGGIAMTDLGSGGIKIRGVGGVNISAGPGTPYAYSDLLILQSINKSIFLYAPNATNGAINMNVANTSFFNIGKTAHTHNLNQAGSQFYVNMTSVESGSIGMHLKGGYIYLANDGYNSGYGSGIEITDHADGILIEELGYTGPIHLNANGGNIVLNELGGGNITLQTYGQDGTGWITLSQQGSGRVDITADGDGTHTGAGAINIWSLDGGGISLVSWFQEGKVTFDLLYSVGNFAQAKMSINSGRVITFTADYGLDIGAAGSSLGFYGTAPITQKSAITAPTGGTTIDTEARAAIASILDALGAARGGVGITA